MDLTPMLIGGDWRPAERTGQAEDVRSPYDGRVVGTVPVAGPDDVEAALAAAETGASRWRRTPAHERARILLRAAQLADERAGGIARTISAEVGKTITEATGEASRSGLQMLRSGREFGNEFRYRDGGLTLAGGPDGGKPARLEGEYLQVDLVQVARGLGARAVRATTAAEVRDALADTRDHDGPVVIVVPAIPHADLPPAGVWWDVAPAEVSDRDTVRRLRAEYEGAWPRNGGSDDRPHRRLPNGSVSARPRQAASAAG